jgi:N,N'-diacetyllegionaminate synthase
MVKRQPLKNKMKVGDRFIGDGEPCFIIAEAGVNHNGSIVQAKKLIDAAVKAGADAVKFQTFRAEDVISDGAAKAAYQKKSTGADESQLGMVKKLELSQADFTALSSYARRKRIMFLSTPFDKGSVDFLDKLGVPAFKIASGEINNFPLLKYIAKKGRPIILSTGMSTLAEVKEALAVIQAGSAEEIVLLHCISCYPAKIGDTNLRAMETLRRAFKLPVGLSDHSTGFTIPIASVALGACIIEKHFTLDKNLPGPDHKASLEPEELKTMVQAVRDVEKAMGSGAKTIAAGEKDTKKAARRSIVAAQDIPAGTVVTQAMLAIKRPGTGIEPKHLGTIVGRKVKDFIRRDELINLRKLY